MTALDRLRFDARSAHRVDKEHPACFVHIQTQSTATDIHQQNPNGDVAVESDNVFGSQVVGERLGVDEVLDVKEFEALRNVVGRVVAVVKNEDFFRSVQCSDAREEVAEFRRGGADDGWAGEVRIGGEIAIEERTLALVRGRSSR